MRSRILPPSRFQTGVFSALPLRSQSASSMPVIAPLPTTPVMPWPCVEANSFCQIRSIRNGPSPTTSGFRSSIAVCTARGQPQHSPTP